MGWKSCAGYAAMTGRVSSRWSFSTSSKEEEDIIASYRSGAHAYVRKPVKFSSFVEAAKALGTFWLIFQ